MCVSVVLCQVEGNENKKRSRSSEGEGEGARGAAHLPHLLLEFTGGWHGSMRALVC